MDNLDFSHGAFLTFDALDPNQQCLSFLLSIPGRFVSFGRLWKSQISLTTDNLSLPRSWSNSSMFPDSEDASTIGAAIDGATLTKMEEATENYILEDEKSKPLEAKKLLEESLEKDSGNPAPNATHLSNTQCGYNRGSSDFASAMRMSGSPTCGRYVGKQGTKQWEQPRTDIFEQWVALNDLRKIGGSLHCPAWLGKGHAPAKQKRRRVLERWTHADFKTFPFLKLPAESATIVAKGDLTFSVNFVLRLRKAHEDIFIYDDSQLIDPENSDVFAYTRTFRDQTVVVAANFTAAKAIGRLFPLE
ncbi:hypothetical protein H2199_005499 [Coniosporium tulheliwenetii]|uniref:Uncharacterized protein n=1 Tax=Coniosporium tulheliwenetii TaxID=3383036 RepID=A0ACC2Z2P3_9PEZI|nr:hypothetical protein H2199_005499 [Cladosporium sp. JES 115]